MLTYLDNNATTQLDPQVLEAMLPWLQDQYANPSSVHYFGQQARHAVEHAREQIAEAINTRARQVVFTGGGTEANALAIRGALAARPDKRHFITTQVEHDSIARLAGRLEQEGYRVTRLGVDEAGRLDPAAFEAAITEDTALASIMHANNETGVIFPLVRLAEIAHERGVLLHTDATQTAGKIPLDVEALPVSLLTMAAHKFHGPKGMGVLYVRRGIRLVAQLVGGHQERDLRAGTENVAGIVGAGEALQSSLDHLDEENTRVRAMRDRLESGLVALAIGARPLGAREERLPNTATVGFEGLQAEAILMLLSNEGICASSGSACSSGSLEPSHVLKAMGVPEAVAHGAVRFSLSRFNTDGDVERTLQVMPGLLERLRAVQPRSVEPIGSSLASMPILKQAE
jgi:cysteine desulfurase